ncbi:hypothetical protein BABINDRAFT_136508 [Babjeviella inositovora NRRL Y-12698]|uniref:Uncharacterized protein n=1 Tax=Babjeviella inositovora NRRL Y-12698 TaxID=984486 RepID=A0A1E3QQC9_9ASCO|nr:uncharacterized protein BABINDRAFT_136508 [Babjeviella inositovora NRRL Y-12698]ODQ79848.1 hypothetical protein BABINDRAFT_136508 [Babjeviella inositovora NRRL Y-12698]
MICVSSDSLRLFRNFIQPRKCFLISPCHIHTYTLPPILAHPRPYHFNFYPLQFVPHNLILLVCNSI